MPNCSPFLGSEWGGGAGQQVQRGFEAVGLARSQRQRRSSTHWWGAEAVWVDEKYGWARAALAEIRRLGSYCRSCCGERRRDRLGPRCGHGPIAPKQLPSNPEPPKATISQLENQFQTLLKSGDKDFVLVLLSHTLSPSCY